MEKNKELEHITSELKLATEIRNIKSKLEELTPLLDELVVMIDAKDVSVTKLVDIVSEYKKIKQH